MRVSNMPTNTIFQKLLVLFFFVFGTQFFAQDSIATPSTFQVENGKTIILSTTATNPKPIKINQKTYTWIPHPSDKSQKIESAYWKLSFRILLIKFKRLKDNRVLLKNHINPCPCERSNP